MGITDSICAKEERIPTVLYRILKDEHRDRRNAYSILLTHACLNSLGEVPMFSNLWRQFCVLENWNRRPRYGRNEIYISSRSAKILKQVLRSENLLEQVGTRDKYYTINRKLAICPCTPRWCPYYLDVCRETPEPPEERTETTVESQCTIDTSQLLLLQGSYLLLWSRNLAWHNGHIVESDWHDLWTTIHYKRNWTQVIFLSLQHI